ncbi:MAG: OB-fold domain-containing protein [Acidimicrobiales bacterium]
MTGNERTGILAWGMYLPYWRLQRAAIGATLGGPAGRGTRAVASYDEDTTTMGVEAARRALRALRGSPPDDLYFATPAPTYLDKTNATAIHAAVELPEWSGAYDLLGSVRSSVAALRAAQAQAASGGTRSLAVVADLRTGLAGGPEERDSGDGAAAFVFGPGSTDNPIAAELVAHAAVSSEFLDRWRIPGDADSQVWEERFGQEVYVPLVEAAAAEAWRRAGVVAADIDYLVLAGLHVRGVQAAGKSLGTRPEATVADRSAVVGNLGAAQAGMLLADALEQAAPGDLIAVVVVADGADVSVFRATDAITEVQSGRAALGMSTVADSVGAGRDDLPYARFLTWRGGLRREPPRRPDPERAGAPATWRVTPWKSGFTASDCRACGFRHLPPSRVCLRCRTIDEMDPVRMADAVGRVATFTVDHLAFSPSPPVVGAVVDFEGGGRYRCEMTDVDPERLAIGSQVEMAFRVLSTAKGIHNYFWKARPVGTLTDGSGDERNGDA